MNQTDKTQIHRALNRCASELRGVAHRLSESGERDAAEIVEDMAGDVLAKWNAFNQRS